MIWTLIPVSAIYGLAAALVFRRFTDEAAIRGTMNRMMAHVLELRLFLDSPALVLRAQWDLLRENLHLVRVILPPAAILAALFIVLFPQLDAMYGLSPLHVGEPSVVTAHLDAAGVLEAPAGIEIETSGARDIHAREVGWRVRPLGRVSGDLKLQYPGGVLTKQIVAGSGVIYGWKFPFSRPEIEIHYPRMNALGVNWMVWFFLISTATAIGYIGYRQ